MTADATDQPSAVADPVAVRRVALASLVGTTIEWYDFGPQATAYAELVPASVRYRGASFAYAIGAIVGGGSAPLVAQALIGATGTSLSVSVYVVVVCLVTLAAVLALREGSPAEREAFVLGESTGS